MPESPKSWPRGFWSLMFTQFQGAFSDNALRWLVIFPVLASVTVSEADKENFVGHSSLLFAVPFLLFATVGGWMADRFSKRSVMIGVKLGEIGIMLFAAVALKLEMQALQLAAICLMGFHSTIFAPAKYGIMPEVLPTSKLSAGNGILELLTFIGIILGTFAGGWLAETLVHREMWAGLLLAGMAAVGLVTSIGIAKVPAADPGKKFNPNIIGEIWNNLRVMKADRDLWRANWGNTAFFFISMLVQLNLALFAQKVFHLKPTEQASLQAALSLGIGVGSMLAGRLSLGRIEYGLIPVGAGMMALAGFGLGWPGIVRMRPCSARDRRRIFHRAHRLRLAASPIASNQRRGPGSGKLAVMGRHRSGIRHAGPTRHHLSPQLRPDLLVLRLDRGVGRLVRHLDATPGGAGYDRPLAKPRAADHLLILDEVQRLPGLFSGAVQLDR